VPSHLEKWGGARAPRAPWFRRHCDNVTHTVLCVDTTTTIIASVAVGAVLLVVVFVIVCVVVYFRRFSRFVS